MTAVRGGRVINSGSNTVRDSGANHNWQGRNYIISWREGRNGFSHAAARSYCRGRGMRIISLDNPQKAQHFLNLVGSDNAPYFWAGGQISSWVNIFRMSCKKPKIICYSSIMKCFKFQQFNYSGIKELWYGKMDEEKVSPGDGIPGLLGALGGLSQMDKDPKTALQF